MEFDWRPGIGDPTFLGWATVVLYVLATLSCLRTGRALKRVPDMDTEGYRAWLTFTVIFFCLGVNKQLDLQSAFTEVGRLIAHRYGWYDERRVVQFVFVVLLVTGGTAAIIYTGFRFRNSPFPTALTAVGIAFVIAFVVVRAVSFHHADVFLHTTVFGWRWNWILEVGGISLSLIGSLLRRMQLTRDVRRIRLRRIRPLGNVRRWDA